LRHYKLNKLNLTIGPKIDTHILYSLNNLTEIEFDFPKVIDTIRFYSMGIVKACESDCEDFIELVGSLFPTHQPYIGEKHIGNIRIYAYHGFDNPQYEVNWELIEYIGEEYFIATQEDGRRLNNRIEPLEEYPWREFLLK
jgi:hypothetical protein